MLYRLAAILALCLLFTAGCGDDSSTNPDTFTDGLTVGTGKKGNDLVGQGDAFYGESISIFWRVESVSEFQGTQVSLLVEQHVDGYGWKTVYYTEYGFADYYSHVMVSSYYHQYGYGRFRATATLVASKHLIGSAEFTVQATPAT